MKNHYREIAVGESSSKQRGNGENRSICCFIYLSAGEADQRKVGRMGKAWMDLGKREDGTQLDTERD